MAKAKREALIVLGMHRSGTSALSGMLAKLGAREPSTLMPPTEDNPRGYWESLEFMRLHDQILSSSGSSWSDWEKFNPDWFDSLTASMFRDELPGVLEKEFGDARLLLLKDPRICRFLPFWLRALKDLDIVPKVVIPTRHPMEVAQSLRVRDHFGRARALLIWLRHVLDAENESRHVARCFVRYSDLLDDWRLQSRRMSDQLGIKWPRRSSAVEMEIDAHLAIELRRQVVDAGITGGEHELTVWVRDTQRALDQLADDAGDHAQARRVLDGIRQKFDHTAAIYGPAVHEQISQADTEIVELKRTMSAQSQQVGDLSARIEEAQRLCSSSENQAAASELRAQELSGRVAALEEAVAAGARLVAAATQAAESLSAQLSTQGQAFSELQARLLGREAELETRSSEMAALREVLAQQADTLTAQMSVQQELTTRLLDGEERALRASAEHDHIVRELNVASESKTTQIERLDAAVLRLELRTQVLVAENAEYKRQGEMRFAELAKLTTRLLDGEERALRASAEHDRIVRELNAASESKTTQIERLQEKFEELVHSTSWRLTSPLRILSGLFRGRHPDLPGKTRGDRDAAALLRTSGLFDEAWYLDQNPDVRESGVDPVEHYLQFGAAENRDPAPGFSTADYRARHADIEERGINPLLHYIRHGRSQERSVIGTSKVEE